MIVNAYIYVSTCTQVCKQVSVKQSTQTTELALNLQSSLVLMCLSAKTGVVYRVSSWL